MEEKKYNYCLVAGTTDVGCVRKANEDSMGSRETQNGLVVVVCDGMGGHVGGAMASKIAVETILDFLDAKFYSNPQEAIGLSIDAANEAVLARTEVQPELRGMGSTCVLLLIRDGKVYIGSVGDSRIYLVRNRIAKQLTKDQSYVQMLVDMGQITEEQAETHPRKNEITNAIGLQGMKHATVLPDPIYPEAGDCFLLCSDGLSGMVPKREIGLIAGDIINMRPQERTDKLIEKAKANGGLDNVTAQIVEFSIAPNKKESGNKKKKLTIAAIIAVVLIALGIGAYFMLSSKEEEKVVRCLIDNVEFAPNGVAITITKTEKGIEVNGKEYSGECDLSVENIKYDNKRFNLTTTKETATLSFTTMPCDTADLTLILGTENYRFLAPVTAPEKPETPQNPQPIKKPNGGLTTAPTAPAQKPAKPTEIKPEDNGAIEMPADKPIGTTTEIDGGEFDEFVQMDKSVLMRIWFVKDRDGKYSMIKYQTPKSSMFDKTIVDEFDMKSFICDPYCDYREDQDTIIIYHPVVADGSYECAFSIDSKTKRYPFIVKLKYNKVGAVLINPAKPEEQPVESSNGDDGVGDNGDETALDTIFESQTIQMRVNDIIKFNAGEGGFVLDQKLVLTSYDSCYISNTRKLIIHRDNEKEHWFKLVKGLETDEIITLRIYGDYNENKKVIQINITRKK